MARQSEAAPIRAARVVRSGAITAAVIAAVAAIGIAVWKTPGSNGQSVSGSNVGGSVYQVGPDAHVTVSEIPRLQRLPTPEPLRPFDNVIFDGGPPRVTVLTWTPVKGADHYLVDLQDQVFGSAEWYDLPPYPVAVTAETYTFEFIGAQPGRWRVTAVAADQTRGNPSKWRHFRYQQ